MTYGKNYDNSKKDWSQIEIIGWLGVAIWVGVAIWRMPTYGRGSSCRLRPEIKKVFSFNIFQFVCKYNLEFKKLTWLSALLL